MGQINFRISEEEKHILQLLAHNRGLTITEFVKHNIFRIISHERVDLAFKLLQEGKINRKKAWKISGLNGSEFLKEWTRRGAEEKIPDELTEKSLEIAMSLKTTEFLKKSKSSK
ncbi:MAG: hypothetical protein K9W44_08720 [Candidatus Lokiarchaeota archaeon]|nr:hypothetical protein [Candidatus Harpocratesius repetitus]